jgi:GntR family transcriptional regulator
MNDKLPLYIQVREKLVERLTGQVWVPGQVLPSEISLAKELDVSQGTVRKAIDQLCSDGVLTRSQGRGTFVSEQTEELANFRFFRLTDSAGNRVMPELQRQVASAEKADSMLSKALGLRVGTKVHVLDRVRTVAGERAILETITVPDALMPKLSDEAPLPNALYPHYQARYGISVVRTEDRLTSVAANSRQARTLSVPTGAPLLQIERVAVDLAGRSIEHRMTRVVTRDHAYTVEIS